MLTSLVPVLFTFVLKLKNNNNSGAKGLKVLNFYITIYNNIAAACFGL